MRTDLTALFAPTRVAVVADFGGGSARAASTIARNLLQATGTELVVVPRGEKPTDLPSVARLDEVGPLDVVVIYLPAPQVAQVVREAGAVGCRFAIVQSAGFGEAQGDGQQLEKELVLAGQEAGVRLVGPNCTGVLNGHRNLATATVPMPDMRAGGASLLVQSGVMAGAVLAQVMNLGTFGVAKACSLGNKADLEEAELLAHLGKDPSTRAVGLYLEWISDPDTFIQVGRAVVDTKPVVALVGGQTEAGAELTRRHTARPASDRTDTAGVVHAAGIPQVQGFTEMLEVCNGMSVLAGHRGAGKRIGIVTLTGSGAVVVADALQSGNLTLASVGDATREKMADFYPRWLEPDNPLDVWPAAAHHGLEAVVPAAIQALEQDPGVDQILAILPVLRREDRGSLPGLLPEGDRLLRKPFVCWYYGGSSPTLAATVEPRGVAIVSSLESAVSLLREIGRSPGEP